MGTLTLKGAGVVPGVPRRLECPGDTTGVLRELVRVPSGIVGYKVIFIKMRQNHNFETWRIEGECFQESLIIPLNSTSSHSHLRQR